MPPCILRHKVAPQNKITAARFPPALKAGGEKEIENSICVATHHFILKAKHNTFLLLSFGTGFRNLFLAVHNSSIGDLVTRAGPQTEKWENLNGTNFFCCL